MTWQQWNYSSSHTTNIILLRYYCFVETSGPGLLGGAYVAYTIFDHWLKHDKTVEFALVKLINKVIENVRREILNILHPAQNYTKH